MREKPKTVDAARFLAFRKEQKAQAELANETNADLGEEPVSRRRTTRCFSPRELAEMEFERNDVLGLLEEETADLREIGEDGVPPPPRHEGYRILRKGKETWTPKNPEAVGILIYLVMVMIYKHRCTREEAFSHVANTGIVDHGQIASLFYRCATDAERKYLPYKRSCAERNGRLVHRIGVRRDRF